MVAVRDERGTENELESEHETGHIERDAKREKAETEDVHLEAVDSDKLGDSGDDEHHSDEYFQHRGRYTQSFHQISRWDVPAGWSLRCRHRVRHNLLCV